MAKNPKTEKATSLNCPKFRKSSKGKPETALKENAAIFIKHDGCTMQLFHGLSETNAAVRVGALRKLYNDWDGHFIIAKTKIRTKK